MAAPQTQTQPLLSTFQKHIEDMRSLIFCKICIKPLYEPYILTCGHTYCYSCLTSWFARKVANTHQRKDNNCPDCRAAVVIQPAPNYLLRDLVHMFIGRIELLEEHETPEEHVDAKDEEARLMAIDKAGPGLFNGVFGTRGPFRRRPGFAAQLLDMEPIRDRQDGVDRCPECMWELEDGQCGQCFWPNIDSDEGSSIVMGLSDGLVDSSGESSDGETIETQSVLTINSDGEENELDIDHDVDPIDQDLRSDNDGADDYNTSDADEDLPAAVRGGIDDGEIRRSVVPARPYRHADQARIRTFLANMINRVPHMDEGSQRARLARRVAMGNQAPRLAQRTLAQESQYHDGMTSSDDYESETGQSHMPSSPGFHRPDAGSPRRRRNFNHEEENDYNVDETETETTHSETPLPEYHNHDHRHISISSGEESEVDIGAARQRDWEDIVDTAQQSSEGESAQVPARRRGPRQQRHVISDDSDEEDDNEQSVRHDVPAGASQQQGPSDYSQSDCEAPATSDSDFNNDNCTHPGNLEGNCPQLGSVQNQRNRLFAEASSSNSESVESVATTVPPQPTATRRAHLNDQRVRRGNNIFRMGNRALHSLSPETEVRNGRVFGTRQVWEWNASPQPQQRVRQTARRAGRRRP